MEKETIIQFVCFETSGDNNEFMSRWEEISKRIKGKQKIRLHREVGTAKRSRYLSQHNCHKDEFKFVFKNARRSAHFPEVEMKVRQLGGYVTEQVDWAHNSTPNEIKLYAFLKSPKIKMEELTQLIAFRCLNVYQAYFESSEYEHILEFLIEKDNATEMMNRLKSYDPRFELAIYKECTLQKVV